MHRKDIKSTIGLYVIAGLFAAVLFMRCDTGPRVIEAEPLAVDQRIEKNEAIASQQKKPFSASPPSAEKHEVVIEDMLTTAKYAYLYVSELGKKYWIAISKREVEIGQTYLFQGGILKKNFYSQEFDRVFDTVYLVSKFWKKATPLLSTNADGAPESSIPKGASLADLTVDEIEPTEGAISLEKLFADKDQYVGDKIKITGKCVKVNPKIMGRNWLHIQDGSGQDLDLTVTTTEQVPLGAVVTLEGTIAIDRDFGAGYRYDIIMEGAEVR